MNKIISITDFHRAVNLVLDCSDVIMTGSLDQEIFNRGMSITENSFLTYDELDDELVLYADGIELLGIRTGDRMPLFLEKLLDE